MHLQQDTWCFKEFSSVKLGDKRLNKRLLKVASDLLNSPTEPISATCNLDFVQFHDFLADARQP